MHKRVGLHDLLTIGLQVTSSLNELTLALHYHF